MVQRAADADFEVWKNVGKTLSRATLEILKSQDKGTIYDRLKAEQVTLIKSIPLDAAQTVVEWTREGLINGERWEGISERIQNEIGRVTESRANCIARTETARARSNFTQARAQAVGSTHYVWHTVGDESVREDHRELDETIQAWDSPPISDRKANIRSNPGCVYNCRCFAEPLYPKTGYEDD